MTATLTAYQARLRPDGHHAVQLRFTVELADALRQRENIGDYCDLLVSPPGETIKMAGVFNVYSARLSADETVFVLGFLVPLRFYGDALKTVLEYVGVSGNLRVDRSQERLPWAKEDDAADDETGNLF